MATKRTDAAGAARAIDGIVRALADPDAVADAFGAAVATEARARGNAAGRPRQAHLVADAIGYRDGQISLSSGYQAGNGTAGELIYGAEFGSDRHTQFGPRSSGGYWLFPTLRDAPPAAIEAGEDGLDELIGRAL